MVVVFAPQRVPPVTMRSVAVIFGSGASFSSPAGYQTITPVDAAGNDRFWGFLKVGVPMNIIIGRASCFAIAPCHGG